MAEFDNEYPPNSNLSKQQKEEKKEIIPSDVNVRSRKKTAVSRFASNFIEEDAHSIGSYIFGDILIPALKKLVDDMISNTVHMALWGSSGRKNRSEFGGVTYRSYSSYSDRRDDRRRSRDRSYDLDEDPIFDTRGDAELVLEELDNILDRYRVLSVADFKEICRMRSTYTDNKYGWTSIASARVIGDRDGWTIRMPKAMPID